MATPPCWDALGAPLDGGGCTSRQRKQW